VKVEDFEPLVTSIMAQADALYESLRASPAIYAPRVAWRNCDHRRMSKKS
jgi:hypothetical protein